MNKQRRVVSLILGLALILSAAPIAQGQIETKVLEMMDYYYDLMLSGNYESARAFWEPSALFRSERLGIEYEGIPLKADCSSPIMNSIKRISQERYPGLKGRATLDSNVYMLKFAATVDGREIMHNYFARLLGQDLWFFYGQDVYCSGWAQTETKYFRFYISSRKTDFFNLPGAESLDMFVEQLAEKLNIPKERMDLLKQQKIEYYLCSTDAEQEKISGVAGRGHFDPAADAIFSVDFPDFHLVAKQLINFRLQKLPLFPIPLFDEGFSIYLGGRWQRSSAVITDFGRYILNNDLTEIDSVLVQKDFDEAIMADITYPVDACLTEYIITRLGMENFLEFYKSLSGGTLFRDTVTSDFVKTAITEKLGMAWDGVEKEFMEYMAVRPDMGGKIFPGQKINKNVLLTEDNLMLYASKDWFQVKLFVPDSMVGSYHFLFGKSKDLENKKSYLFDEQYKGKTSFQGYRYGLMIDKNEIGLYDYATNQLKAKYVYTFDPSEEYYNPEKKVITAYFSTAVFGGKVPKVDDGISLSQR